MKKELVKRLVYDATFLFTFFLMRFLIPLLPRFDSLGKFAIGGLTIYLSDLLVVASFYGFFKVIYFIFARIIDQKMKGSRCMVE